ncbi:hypothetical protein U9K52_08490 [Chryseobacterium sp. MHB01]|uniref:hypothetical protein n=1 Tax=Chryseobacterium sp. MHB01 TaxID=3109433 RepID=UPI002AFEF8B3|nr:hypothetical protein [Chryseobacterium sp. MHB01]MEA1848946.1 hypothetical protein [Chryseobacterium sp. MHB01]
MVKYYKDSMELPLINYIRIVEKGDFFLMIKGIEDQPEDFNEEEAKSRFDIIVQDYILSINHKNSEVREYSNLKYFEMEINRFTTLVGFLKNIKLIEEIKPEKGKNLLNLLLSGIKCPQDKDVDFYIQFFGEKITTLKNDIEKSSAILENSKENNQEESRQTMYEVVANVEMGLERAIDMEKTSLYLFGVYQDQVIRKIEELRKISSK